MRLGNLKGTLQENMQPLITTENNGKSVQLNAMTMALLEILEGDRVDFHLHKDDLYIMKAEGKGIGRSVTKTGKFQQEAVWSALVGMGNAGADSRWLVSKDVYTIEGDENCHLLTILDAPKSEEPTTEQAPEAETQEVEAVERAEVVEQKEEEAVMPIGVPNTEHEGQY
jgi:hypothetical protein